ncbi:hypothetical protein [Pelagibacterium xiamenense]|uniref:hypothetical protein n=1 Tax=Pelagibacterium xiamenense TaxID=2901140 RepID=UPI001E5A3454|nr:hypothetical protein [Pelagibacterium xiamenense]MCD7058348.1 hypothetical protein [Pelagibacterium xiamenense]
MKPLAIIAVIAGLAAGTAQAQEWRSEYTHIDIADECTMVSQYELGASWTCPGYRGYPLLVSEGDLRFFVSYGPDAADEIARRQTLPPFNTIHDTLEWLVVDRPEFGPIPVATILRYYLDAFEDGGEQGQVLVVTRLEIGNTCHVAYVDARANPDANTLARRAAERFVPGFDCAAMEPERVGAWEAGF